MKPAQAQKGEPEQAARLTIFLLLSWLQVGWVVGPDRLLQHLRTVHQNSVYHCATIAQVRQPPAPGPAMPRPSEQG